LRECLDLVNGQVPLLIEFKCNFGNYKALCEAADAILRDYHGIYFVQSFFPFAMGWYRRHRKDICRGQLSSVFRKGDLQLKLLGSLMIHVISRPDFISFYHLYEKNIPFRLVRLLGAFPVGWTFRSSEALVKSKRFRTYIFELFSPEK
ncbi:MAG: glycerophosphodiester phosphodiesterase, partial [Clostridia bacterium]|nr:glycerophosphodiester phosphodiesterase [Clostridia bacterium]